MDITIINSSGVSKVDALRRDIRRLRESNNGDEISKILGRMEEMSISNNEIALDDLAKINVKDLNLRSKDGVFLVKICVASNRHTREETLHVLAKDSVKNWDLSVPTRSIQQAIIRNKNTSVVTLHYLENNSKYSDIRELANDIFMDRATNDTEISDMLRN
jgi:hypothetical protein